jgi:membrane protein DedA with SNARE-associated domain
VTIHHLVISWGYAAVFLLVGAESLGVPLPGETTLVAAAAYAGTTHRLSVWVIFAVAAAAAILGDTTGYWIGDKGGYRLVRRYGHYVRLDEKKLNVARYLFDHHGGAVVFFGRFVSVLRTYAAFLAGTTRMRYRRFLVFNASGGILWAAAYSFGAYYAGSQLARASLPVEIGFGGAILAVVVVGILIMRRKMDVLSERAEAQYGKSDDGTASEGADGSEDDAEKPARASRPEEPGEHAGED